MSVCQMNLVCRCDKCLQHEASNSERVLGWFYRDIRTAFQMCEVFRNAIAGVEPFGVYALDTLPIDFQCPCCGFTLLHLAVSVNSRQHVQYYLHRSVNIHAKNDNGDTALHLAVLSSDYCIVDDLLRHGADPNALDLLGCTPLQIFLSNQGKSQIVIETLLHYGARLNDLFVGTTLAQLTSVNQQTPNGKTPLCDAVLRNDVEVTRGLLQVGACPNLRLTNQSALMMASFEGFNDCVITLLEAGANISQKDSEGRTALHYAVLGDKPNVLLTLINHGGDCEIEDLFNHTILDLAILGNRVHIVELLLDRGARFGYGEDLVFQAVEHGATDTLVTLIKRHVVDINVRNEDGECLLTFADTVGQHEFVQFLLDNGAQDDYEIPSNGVPDVLSMTI